MIKRKIKSTFQKLQRRMEHHGETALILQGKAMAWHVANLPPNTDFRQVGFKVFSQWDEDGIIQYLISKLPIQNRTFIEFGVENYEESNTRFLLVNNHWHGMVLDANGADIHYIQSDRIHWQYDLQAKEAWITRENIDSLLAQAGFPTDLGLISIDLNGNDYWIWEALAVLRPRIVIVEYNSLLGLQPICVPYLENFDRTSAHHSNLYYGCSLSALSHLAKNKGYILLGSNIWGHNAFFVRSDIAGEFKAVAPEQAYVESKFRESRDSDGRLTYVRGIERIKLIEHLPVIDVVTGRQGSIKELWTSSRSVFPA